MISRFSIWLLLLPLLIHGIALCQEKVISMDGITDAGFDPQGNIYLSTSQGTIIKFDSTYQKLITYTSENIISISSIDVSNRFRIFGFYKNNQSYVLLDHNLKVLNENSIDPQMIGNGVAACLDSDHTIWFFDDLDFSLKKFNPTLNQMIINIKLPLLIDAERFSIIQLEEYQNRIYVNNPGEGVYVFDPFGNFLKELKISTWNVFNIFREKLYYIDDSTIKTIHIYSNETAILPEIHCQDNIITVLTNSHRMLLIYPDFVFRIK